MQAIQKVFLFFVFLYAAHTTSAQILNPSGVLKRKLEQKVNNALERQLEKQVDRALDSALTKKSKSKTTDVQIDNGEAQEADKTMGTIGGKLGKLLDFDAKPKSSYAFSSSILQKMTAIDKKKTETSYLKILFSTTQQTIGIASLDANKVDKSEMGSMIMDVEQKAFFMFSTDKKGQKHYFGMRLKEQALEPTTDASSTAKARTITPTGKHKTIMGYDCAGYQSDGEKGDTFIYWVTNSSVTGMQSYVDAMRQMAANQPQMAANSNDMVMKLMKEGKYILGHDYISKNGDQLLMELEKINMTDPSSLNTGGYKSAFEK
jgi:hypothetical protein